MRKKPGEKLCNGAGASLPQVPLLKSFPAAGSPRLPWVRYPEIKRTAPLPERPASLAVRLRWLFAGAFAGFFSLRYAFRHFRFDGIQIETRSPLHRWIFDEGFELLGDHLLH